jgi:hypothetical protein
MPAAAPTLPILRCPPHIVRIVARFVWGDADDWRRALRSCVLPTLPSYTRTLPSLKASRQWRHLDGVEEHMYCEWCGDKTLWAPFLISGDKCAACRAVDSGR